MSRLDEPPIRWREETLAPTCFNRAYIKRYHVDNCDELLSVNSAIPLTIFTSCLVAEITLSDSSYLSSQVPWHSRRSFNTTNDTTRAAERNSWLDWIAFPRETRNPLKRLKHVSLTARLIVLPFSLLERFKIGLWLSSLYGA